MEYFIVSTLALCIATYLIYIIANKIFHIHLGIKSLVLCACCALFIGNILPRFVIGFAGFAGTLGVLIICAILFSYFIAYHAECEEKELNNGLEKIESQLAVQEKRLVEYNMNDCLVENQPKKWAEVISEMDELLESETSESAVTLENDLENEAELEELLMSIEPENKEIVAEMESNEEAEETAVAVSENRLEIAPDLESKYEPNLESKPEEVAITIEADLASRDIEEDAEIIEQESEIQPEVDEIPENESVLEEIDFCSSLDELLDYAFTKKDELQLMIALKAFTKALSLCKDTDFAPMVIVEMSNIFKAQGQYEQAIQLFSEGCNLPYVLENNMLNQQFIEMIAFLRIIKNNLLEHQVGFIPYDKIPSDLMHKINEEFHDWLTLSCAKPQTRRISEE